MIVQFDIKAETILASLLQCNPKNTFVHQSDVSTKYCIKIALLYCEFQQQIRVNPVHWIFFLNYSDVFISSSLFSISPSL